MWGKQARLHLCNGDLGYPSAGEIKSVPSACVGSTSCAYERHLFCKRCDVPQARDPVVDQTCNEGNCADEDCNGEKAAYEAALKKRNTPLVAAK